jgi:hypothetical protein
VLGVVKASPAGRGALVTAALLLLLAGCGLSGYRYVSHAQRNGAELYFKLPTSWRTFGLRQLAGAAGRAPGRHRPPAAGPGWLETFVGSPNADAATSTLIDGRSPRGIAEAVPLSPKQWDELSFARLRTEILPSDPLNPPTPDPYQVLSYSTFTRSSYLWGSKMVVDIKGHGGEVSTFSQQAMVDSQTRWLYLIAVSCRAACYASYEGVINQVLGSWGVKTG